MWPWISSCVRRNLFLASSLRLSEIYFNFQRQLPTKNIFWPRVRGIYLNLLRQQPIFQRKNFASRQGQTHTDTHTRNSRLAMFLCREIEWPAKCSIYGAEEPTGYCITQSALRISTWKKGLLPLRSCCNLLRKTSFEVSFSSDPVCSCYLENGTASIVIKFYEIFPEFKLCC